MDTKPRVYWRPIWHEDQDPADACWAVKVDHMDIGFDSWEEAFQFAYLYPVLKRF